MPGAPRIYFGVSDVRDVVCRPHRVVVNYLLLMPLFMLSFECLIFLRGKQFVQRCR